MRIFGQFRKLFLTLGNMLRGHAVHPVPDFGVEDLERLEFLKDYPIATVIDVGAHVGEFARTMRTLRPDAGIYSFEPQAFCQALLREVPGIQVFPFALGEEEGALHFEENVFTACSSVLPLAHRARGAFPYAAFPTRDTAVPVRRLDDVLDASALPHEILLKIDVQGFEDRVLRGAPNMLSQAKWLLIEVTFKTLYHGQMLAPELRTMIEASGFRFAKTCREMRHTLTGEVVQADLLFERLA